MDQPLLLTYEKIGRRIVETFDDLSPALKAVAGCITQNPNDVAILTLSDLSKKYDIPASNFVRFSKSLGFSGFGDLQRVYRSRLVDIIPSVEERLDRFERELTPGTSPGRGLERLIREDFRLLGDLNVPAVEKTCSRFADVIVHSSKVFVTSAARFFPVSFFFNYAFVYLGMDVTLLDNQGFLAREYANNFKNGTCLLVSSFSYYHRDVLSLAELAKQREATVLAITDFELSPLTKIADACIYLPGMGDNFRVSIGPTFVIAQHIVNEVAAAKGLEAPHLQPPE
jgi:DNA-binding MurR/RpiR family transcriptional regulator